MVSALNKLLAPLRNRIANMVARAVVQLVSDGGKLQVLQLSILDGETREALERVQEYGFTSHPMPGAEAVALFVGGRRDHGLVVAVDDRRYRPRDLLAGEVALYNKDAIVLLLKSSRAVFTAPELRLGSDSAAAFVALADLVDSRIAAIRTAFNAHTHTGVTTGSGSSGPPGAALAAQASVAAGKVKAE